MVHAILYICLMESVARSCEHCGFLGMCQESRLMKTLILALLAGAGCLVAADASAQSMWLRGIASSTYAVTDCASVSPRSTLVDPGGDDGGGEILKATTNAQGAAASNSVQSVDVDVIDTANAGAASGDPVAPAALTPKRPTYRWQSLVPGAIK